MFNIGFSELVILGIIALLFIGPKELPEIARTIGRFLNELKRTTSDLTSTMMRPQDQFRDQVNDIFSSIREPVPPHDGEKPPVDMQYNKPPPPNPEAAQMELPIAPEEDKKPKGES